MSREGEKDALPRGQGRERGRVTKKKEERNVRQREHGRGPR